VRDAVDPALFKPYDRDGARQRLGLKLEEVLVLFPHDVTQPNKRLGLAEAAVERLRQLEPCARLWVVNGQHPDAMPLYYSAADVMIVTSALESGPSSAKEALACGLPVVSTRVGDLELFSEVNEAILASDDSPAALTAALVEGLAMGRRPRQSRLPSYLTLSGAADRIATLYREVLAEGRQ
jgi:glycosyltransferase involved in cell wall biosynthesis